MRAAWPLAVLSLTAVLGGVVGGPARAEVLASSPAPTAVVKYYIVGPPLNGHQEYLFAIATKTLGNGNRSGEIFNLNKGRTQPDGGALTDPAVLRPGWLLLLPADASGPGVLTGAPPAVPANGRTAAGGAGVTAAVPAPTTLDGFDSLPRITCVGAAIAAMILALVLLRRGTRLSVPAPRSPPGRPGPAGAYSAATADRLETYGENSGDADRGAGPQTWRLDESPPRPTPEALLTGERGRSPMATDDTTEVPVATGPVATGPVAEPGDPYAQVMEVQVLAASGQDRATVRLAGVRTPRAMPAWIWLDPDEPRPPAPTYVAVGATGQGALCLDLLQAPDVVTVTGDTAPARRLAAVLARQLVDNGTPVTVVGPILGPPIAGTHVVRSMAAAEETTADPVAPQIVFCSPGPDDAATVRRFTTRSSPRTVVVIVGDVRRGRWSVEVHATQCSAPTATREGSGSP